MRVINLQQLQQLKLPIRVYLLDSFNNPTLVNITRCETLAADVLLYSLKYTRCLRYQRSIGIFKAEFSPANGGCGHTYINANYFNNDEKRATLGAKGYIWLLEAAEDIETIRAHLAVERL